MGARHREGRRSTNIAKGNLSDDDHIIKYTTGEMVAAALLEGPRPDPGDPEVNRWSLWEGSKTITAA